MIAFDDDIRQFAEFAVGPGGMIEWAGHVFTFSGEVPRNILRFHRPRPAQLHQPHGPYRVVKFGHVSDPLDFSCFTNQKPLWIPD